MMEHCDGHFIFVLAHDGGVEGHSPPVQAFMDEKTAWAALALLAGTETFHIYRVPIWPNQHAPRWYDVKPHTPPAAA